MSIDRANESDTTEQEAVESKTLSPLALSFDQERMYSQFDRAVESKDMQTAQAVGRRIINDAKANGSRPGVIEQVEETLAGEQ
mgnify:CR=1 FL=1